MNIFPFQSTIRSSDRHILNGHRSGLLWFTGLSGSGPAYVYTFIESLSLQAQEEGLALDEALKLATQTVIGAARMIEQTGMTPRQLVEQVTSPGGTTLAGLAALTEHGFEKSIAAGVHAASERSREIARES